MMLWGLPCLVAACFKASVRFKFFACLWGKGLGGLSFCFFDWFYELIIALCNKKQVEFSRDFLNEPSINLI